MMRDLLQKFEFAFLFIMVVGLVFVWPIYYWIEAKL